MRSSHLRLQEGRKWEYRYVWSGVSQVFADEEENIHICQVPKGNNTPFIWRWLDKQNWCFYPYQAVSSLRIYGLINIFPSAQQKIHQRNVHKYSYHPNYFSLLSSQTRRLSLLSWTSRFSKFHKCNKKAVQLNIF